MGHPSLWPYSSLMGPLILVAILILDELDSLSLLETHPRSAFVLDSIGQTPLSLLFDRHKKSLKEIFRDSGPEKTTSSRPWKQLMVFIRSYCSATYSEYNGSEFRPLHSVAACPCSLSIFQFILNVCKGDVRKRDEFGRLPLSIVASSRCTNGFNGKKKDGRAPRH